MKENEAQKISFQQLGKNSIGKSNAKGKSFDRKRRKEKGDILSIYGKVKVVQIFVPLQGFYKQLFHNIRVGEF